MMTIALQGKSAGVKIGNTGQDVKSLQPKPRPIGFGHEKEPPKVRFSKELVEFILKSFLAGEIPKEKQWHLLRVFGLPFHAISLQLLKKVASGQTTPEDKSLLIALKVYPENLEVARITAKLLMDQEPTQPEQNLFEPVREVVENRFLRFLLTHGPTPFEAPDLLFETDLFIPGQEPPEGS
jgi:hypothetical protein